MAIAVSHFSSVFFGGCPIPYNKGMIVFTITVNL